MHYTVIQPLCRNFRMITTNFPGVRKLRKFTVVSVDTLPYWLYKARLNLINMWHPLSPYYSLAFPSSLIGLRRRPDTIVVFNGFLDEPVTSLIAFTRTLSCLCILDVHYKWTCETPVWNTVKWWFATTSCPVSIFGSHIQLLTKRSVA